MSESTAGASSSPPEPPNAARIRQAARGLSLRAWLILLVTALLVPLLFFGLGDGYLKYRQSQANAGQRALDLARSMTRLNDRELQRSISVLQVLALSPSLQAGNLVAFRAQAEAVTAQQFPGSNMLLLTADGQQLMNTIRPPGAPLPVRPNLESLTAMFATGAPAVSNLYAGAVGARLVVAIDVPVRQADGSILYGLSINPSLKVFGDLIEDERPSENWVVSVFDGKGVHVARRPSPERFVGHLAAENFLPHLLGGHEGIVETTSLEGIPLLTAFSHSDKFAWSIGVGVPRAELTAPALGAALRTLAAAGVLLVLSLLLAMVMARQITQPMAMLRHLAAASDRTEVLGAPATGLHEADEVIKALRIAEQRRRQSEEEERRSRSKLREIEPQLYHAQKMEAIGNLTGGVAHDFNNLLGVIIGSLDALSERGQDDPKTTELAGEGLDAALRGADLIRRLLAFARRQPLQPRRIEANEFVANTVKLLGRVLSENIVISLALDAKTWPVIADPAQLEASVLNLATNARDAMPMGGRLRIATGNRALDEDYTRLHPDAAPGDYAMIEVSDTGTGMTTEVVARIFEPFYTTKEIGKGTGLGLAMVFGFMKQSGGHINVYSEPGVGTTFRLYLPRAAGDSEAAETKPSAAPTAQGGSETILVVEDNAAMRRVVIRQIEQLGYRVREAENAAAALLILEQTKVDLMFSDVVMPGEKDGIALARAALERWPGLKVILTSGFPGTKVSGEFGIEGGVHLLSKPYRKEELARMLHDVLAG